VIDNSHYIPETEGRGTQLLPAFAVARVARPSVMLNGLTEPHYLRLLTRIVAGRIIAPVFLALESKNSAKVSTQ